MSEIQLFDGVKILTVGVDSPIELTKLFNFWIVSRDQELKVLHLR